MLLMPSGVASPSPSSSPARRPCITCHALDQGSNDLLQRGDAHVVLGLFRHEGNTLLLPEHDLLQHR
eukprot:2556832-Heterocapsa_arctica.AAC.1